MSKIIFFLLCVLFAACNQTSHTNKADSPNKTAQNIFIANEEISSENALVMLVFGSNNCASCERLLGMIAANNDISDILAAHYKSYYINLSHDKKHEIYLDNAQKVRTSAELKEHFKIIGTPTIVFLYNGRRLFSYPGFLSKNRLLATLEILKKSEIWGEDSNKITNLVLELYKKEKI